MFYPLLDWKMHGETLKLIIICHNKLVADWKNNKHKLKEKTIFHNIPAARLGVPRRRDAHFGNSRLDFRALPAAIQSTSEILPNVQQSCLGSSVCYPMGTVRWGYIAVPVRGQFRIFLGGGQLHVVIFGLAATIAGGKNCIETLYRNVWLVIGNWGSALLPVGVQRCCQTSQTRGLSWKTPDRVN